MSALQESRRELMVQLEGLMKLLKVRESPGRSPTPPPPASLPPLVPLHLQFSCCRPPQPLPCCLNRVPLKA